MELFAGLINSRSIKFSILVISVSMFYNADAFSRGLFKETNIKEKAFGLTLGVVGWQDDQPGLPINHRDDIGTETWIDETSFAAHIGYQLPITKTVRFIPIIGAADCGTVTVNGAQWHFEDGHIVNDTKYNGYGGGGLDYGGILVIHHKKWNFSATYTNHTVYFAAAITWGN